MQDVVHAGLPTPVQYRSFYLSEPGLELEFLHVEQSMFSSRAHVLVVVAVVRVQFPGVAFSCFCKRDLSMR